MLLVSSKENEFFQQYVCTLHWHPASKHWLFSRLDPDEILNYATLTTPILNFKENLYVAGGKQTPRGAARIHLAALCYDHQAQRALIPANPMLRSL